MNVLSRIVSIKWDNEEDKKLQLNFYNSFLSPSPLPNKHKWQHYGYIFDVPSN